MLLASSPEPDADVITVLSRLLPLDMTQPRGPISLCLDVAPEAAVSNPIRLRQHGVDGTTHAVEIGRSVRSTTHAGNEATTLYLTHIPMRMLLDLSTQPADS